MIPTRMTDDEYFARVFGPKDAWDGVARQVWNKYRRGLLNLDEVAEQVIVLRRHQDEVESATVSQMRKFTELDWECFSGAIADLDGRGPLVGFGLVVSDWKKWYAIGGQITKVDMIADANGLWLGTVDDWMVLSIPFLAAVAIGNALLSASPVDVKTLSAYGLEYA